MLQKLDKSAGQTAEAGDIQSPHRGTALVTGARAFIQVALMIGVIAASVFIMNRVIDSRPERSGRPQVNTALPVQAETVQIANARPTIRLFGEVEALRVVDLRSNVSGEVMSVDSRLAAGKRVDEGQELFSVDRFEYETALAEARANLAQTEASIAESRARLAAESEQLASAREQAELGRLDLERARSLRGNGALTEKQVEDRQLVVSQREQAVALRRSNLVVQQAQLDQQLAARDRLRLSVARAERNLDDTVVRAPFAGIVRASTVEMGRIVSASDVAVTMYDDTALDVRFTLTNAQYGRIAADSDPLIGRQVSLTWVVGELEYDYQAVVSRIGADIASERGGVDVYARIEPAAGEVQIRPGAFVEVLVPDRLYPQVARIPESALYDQSAVYVIVDGALRRTEVEVKAFDGNHVILDGLQAGDTVLTTRLSSVEEGLSVSVVGAAPQEGAGGRAGGEG